MSTKPSLKYVILYVEDVDRACGFYSSIFDFKERMRQGEYVELETGAVTLALAARQFVSKHLGVKPGPKGAGASEIGVVVPEAKVERVYRAALDAGATSVIAPKRQPWGQLVSYVRDPDGHLVEICSPNE